jgi:phenylacetate-CoA ligase
VSGITGYTGDVLTIRGVKAHPVQIERLLNGIFEAISPRFLVHLYKENHLDMVEIWLEMTDTIFSDEMKILDNTLRKLRQQIFQILGLQVMIKLIEASTFDHYALPSCGVVDDR